MTHFVSSALGIRYLRKRAGVGILCLALVPVLAAFAAASDPMPWRVLQSVRGDTIAVVDGGPFPCASVQCSARVCLTTPATVVHSALSSGARDVPLRLVAPNGWDCTDLAPVRQVLTFWLEGSRGEMEAVLNAHVDLRGRAGLVTYANWLEQPAP